MVANNLLKSILNLLGGNTSSIGSAPYLALSTTRPNADGTGVTEPTGYGYERTLLGGSGDTNYMGQPTEVSGKFTITNNKEIHFNEATGSWGTIGYFALFTSKTGGTMYYSGELTSPISPVEGTVVVIKKDELSISLSAEELSA